MIEFNGKYKLKEDSLKKNSGSELRFEQVVRHGESSRHDDVGKAWSLK